MKNPKQRKRPAREEKAPRAAVPLACKLNLTPLVDVVFLLLVFLASGFRFSTFEGKIDAFLPKDR